MLQLSFHCYRAAGMRSLGVRGDSVSLQYCGFQHSGTMRGKRQLSDTDRECELRNRHMFPGFRFVLSHGRNNSKLQYDQWIELLLYGQSE